MGSDFGMVFFVDAVELRVRAACHRDGLPLVGSGLRRPLLNLFFVHVVRVDIKHVLLN